MAVQSMRTKYVDYSGKPTMTLAQMMEEGTKQIEAIYGQGSLSNPMANGLPGSQTTQAPPRAPAAAPGKGVVKLDMKTGQVVPM